MSFDNLLSNLKLDVNNPTISLDVGGTIIKTNLELLSNGSQYFKDMFSDPLISLTKNSVFIDYDPIIFRHVLNFMRDPRYPYPKKYSFALDYFGVNIYYMKNGEQKAKKCNGCICSFINKNNVREMTAKYMKIIDTPCVCKHLKNGGYGCSLCDVKIDPIKCTKCGKEHTYSAELNDCCTNYTAMISPVDFYHNYK
jgi:hypothetical protein